MAEDSNVGMRAITLGAAGGPKWWGRNDVDAGISTAIIVDGRVYLVDLGSGASRQLARAGYGYSDVEAVFITHMHSDHTVDLASMLLFGYSDVGPRQVPVLGPAARGKLPPLTEFANSQPNTVRADEPTPGIAETLKRLEGAYSTDINDRMFDYGSPSPLESFAVTDIALPATVPFDANNNVAPEMEPFVVFEDPRVRVSAILVDHHPTAPAFAFRFDSRYGSIVISGDTGYCENTIRIAEGSDLLFHEAIDLQVMEVRMRHYPDPKRREAIMSHHRRAHTTAEDAGRVAQSAGAKALVLHHLVPADTPLANWQQASNTFDGLVHIAEDLAVFEV